MSYGIGTRSDNRTPEATLRRKERAERLRQIAANGYPHERDVVVRWWNCFCRSFAHPHTIEAHKHLRSDHDWRTPEERSYDTMEIWEKAI